MSVFILTTSELEANLENQRVASVLYSMHLEEGEVGWGGVSTLSPISCSAEETSLDIKGSGRSEHLLNHDFPVR
jgi:hypothetical protein